MSNDELLTGALMSALAASAAWLIWVVARLIVPGWEPVGLAIVVGGAGAATALLAGKGLLKSTSFGRDQIPLAMGALVGFGVASAVVELSAEVEIVARVLATLSHMGFGLVLGFSSRATGAGLLLAALLSAIDTPFWGTVLLSVAAAAYLERNPTAFRPS